MTGNQAKKRVPAISVQVTETNKTLSEIYEEIKPSLQANGPASKVFLKKLDHLPTELQGIVNTAIDLSVLLGVELKIEKP